MQVSFADFQGHPEVAAVVVISWAPHVTHEDHGGLLLTCYLKQEGRLGVVGFLFLRCDVPEFGPRSVNAVL